MNIKIVYNGEMGFLQTLKNVYEYLIPAKNISFEKFIKYNNNENSLKTNAELVYDKMQGMDFFSLYTEEFLNKICDYNDDDGYKLKPFDKIKDYIFEGVLVCPAPCVFYIDSENVSEGIIIQSTNLIETRKDSNSNYNQNNDEIIFDLVKKNINKKRKRSSIDSKNKREFIKPLVWVWCKSLCPDGVYKPNSIFNLTPFINSIVTNEGETGGNFSINLTSVEGEMSNDGDLKSVWFPKKNSFLKIDNSFLFRKIRGREGNKDNYPDNGRFDERDDSYQREYTFNNRNDDINSEFLDVSSNSKKNTSTRRKVDNLFENILSPNDVVFISFTEDDNDVTYIEHFLTDNKKLNKIQWDMIGLINNISSDSETEGISSTENISGMDLMKLLLEDGTYFFMNSSGSDTPSSIFNNIQIKEQGDQSNVGLFNEDGNLRSSNRTPLGLISSLYIPTQRNINFIMNLLLSKLCNVEICPTKLFENYEDKTIFNIPILENTDEK